MSKKPKCVIVTGRPAAGKTTLAKKIGELLRMPVISRDELKEGYVISCGVSHDELSPDTNRLVTDQFFGIVNQYLTGNVSVVIEAAFQHQFWESRLPPIVKLASTLIVVCIADSATAVQRHLERGLHDPKRKYYHGDLTVQDYIPPKFDLPTIEVSTDGEYIPPIDDLVKQILSVVSE